MFYGGAAVGRNHCVQKKRPRSEIDNWRADNAHGTNFSAMKIGSGYWSAHISLPDNGPIRSIECVHIIRFGDRNDHWTVWTALDIKRLRVDIAYDRTIEV